MERSCHRDHGRRQWDELPRVGVDRSSGDIVWNNEVLTQETRRKEGKNSYATPTPVTDGSRCTRCSGRRHRGGAFDDGNVQWTDERVKFYSQHGLGASPILHENLLIMPFDGCSPVPDRRSAGRFRGKRRDRRARQGKRQRCMEAVRGRSRIAHTTPIVAGRGDSAQLVSTAGDVIQGFDLSNGRRFGRLTATEKASCRRRCWWATWQLRAPGLRNRRSAPSGWTARERDKDAHRLGTDQGRAVAVVANLRRAASFTVTDNGVVSKFDVKDGKLLDQRRIGGNHSASPIYAGGNLYFVSEQGDVTVVDPHHSNSRPPIRLAERCQASPAISGGQIFIRGERTLFCMGKMPAAE